MSGTTTLSSYPIEPGEHGSHFTPKEIAIGVIIGRLGEFFDFFVFGIASALVFPSLFFPFANTYDGLFYAFIIFGFGFIARLPGAILFRVIHDRYGRGAKLTGALFVLGTATVAIPFLPSYSEIGATAIWLLAALRIAQGIGVGGAWDGLPSLLAVTAPYGKRGSYATIAQIGAPVGFCVAIALFAYLYRSTAASDFVDWGWKFAFFTAFAINVVTLFARLRMAISPESEELFSERELTPSPLGELFRTRSTNMLVGALVPAASFALFHLVTIFPLTWSLLFPEEYSLETVFSLQFIGGLLCLATMLISGKVADRIGRRSTLAWGAVLILLFCLPAPFLGNTQFGALAFIPTGFALLGFSLAQAAGAINCTFESRFRYSGALLTNELGWLLGAAFAPLIALVLAKHLGNAGVAIYLFTAAIATLGALWLNRSRMQANE